MRAYVTTSGAIFALLVVVHVWRAIAEGSHQFADPFYVGSTVLAAGMAVWAWRVRGKIPRV
jgi:hypothetical protein